MENEFDIFNEGVLINSNSYNINDFIPTEEDFQKIQEAKTDYDANGKDASFIHTPWGLSRSIKDIKKLIRRLIVAVLLGWKDMSDALLKAFDDKGFERDDLKKIANHVLSNSHLIDNLIDKYSNNNAQPKHWYQIIAYAISGNIRAARHIFISGKDSATGLYRISIGSAADQHWIDKPVFDSQQQAQDFINNISKAHTTRDLSTFKFNISDQFSSSAAVVLDDVLVPVNTMCGPAYMSKGSKKCLESLTEDTIKVKDHKWTNKGKDGTHGTFTTKKAADAQRRAMFANGFREGIEKHDTLNPKLWDENNKLKPEVKEKILDIIDTFRKELEEDDIKFSIKDIVLIGSNCSYNYNKDSDLDVHIIADTKDLHCPDNLYPLLYSAYRSIFNNKFDIDFYGIPVELYIETEDTNTVSNGIYSVLNDKWIKEPVAADIPEIDKDAFDKEFKVWEDKYKQLIKNEPLTEDLAKAKSIIADQVKGEWDAIKNYQAAVDELDVSDLSNVIDILNDITDEEEVHVGELEKSLSTIDDNLESNIADGKAEAEEKLAENESPIDESIDTTKIDEIEKLINDIYQLRKDGLATGDEYSIKNLVFKTFRSKGYLDNLKDLKVKELSKELSLKKETK